MKNNFIVSIRIVMEKGWKIIVRTSSATTLGFNPHRDGEGLEVFEEEGMAMLEKVSIRIVMEKGWKLLSSPPWMRRKRFQSAS